MNGEFRNCPVCGKQPERSNTYTKKLFRKKEIKFYGLRCQKLSYPIHNIFVLGKTKEEVKCAWNRGWFV